MRFRAQAGDTLIEVIVATAILGTTMVAVIGGFLGLSKISGVQSDLGKVTAALASASEYAKNRPCALPLVHNCAAVASVSTTLVPHDSDTSISISAAAANSDTGLTQFVVTVSRFSVLLTNTVVVR